MSIILGVCQMLLGLGCSLANALHFRSEVDLWCEFVPQVREDARKRLEESNPAEIEVE